MKIIETAAIVLALVSLAFCGCVSQAESHEDLHGEAHGEAEGHGESTAHGEGEGHEGHPQHKIIVTSPLKEDVISTQQYVCQIHSCQHIEVRALEGGYLEEIRVSEGQTVKKGELMFKILPTLYQAKLDSEVAEAQRIEMQLQYAQNLSGKGIVSPQEISLKKAELAKAKAQVDLARAELNFTDVKAPFDGIVDRQYCQLGSLIEEGDILTTFSDNSLMWVYFNVPEARYLEYKEELDKNEGSQEDHLQIELKLANGKIFQQHGRIGAIEADFNNTTGNIAFRADFPNPNSLLRNGQTGTILIHRTLKDVLVIPQRATYEILDKRYAFVVDKDNVVHQRDIEIDSEQEDIFVLKDGLAEGEKIIFEGIRQVRDGDKIEYEYRAPEEILNNQKFPAE
ncbi:efflux RND transporter periplasmic adaptor subunit [Blastopirellula marina]|uniref:Efflux RND transporter periplasmic adaptor subunit n=1 Tax=Blastopirellula marina TaxID=124 RepID=A0A2S8F2W7_9BACT|nr:efflux RND transporter periplasmic adaptor subunit [Blastopirellula marina]PQO26506.1 efflux RND transporter periplasmic adaptor subunit [Blastopirellula marina]PQO46860.1 efflux RND transporter periplasmic adaptor subunit [Blastopirellula marina]PTL40819.1 efflux RND transporter periplasmic adaptor subunit [Blastopirellula marina]